MEATRRAFLLGRRPPETPWAAFLRRLRRTCEGELRTLDTATAPAGAARWAPATAADVRVARELCVEYGVILALADTRGDVAGRPCLWVEPRGLDTLVGLAPGLDACLDLAPAHATPVTAPGHSPATPLARPSRWRAGPGVTLAALARAGLARFATLPGEMTVAAWLASRACMDAAPGRACPPGLFSIDVLLADGAAETLGPFGAGAGLPLRSASGQALIPALYTLSTRADTAWCRAQADWPARYRLDALAPPPPAEANLAGLLAGHEGALGWVESVVLLSDGAATVAASCAIGAAAGTGAGSEGGSEAVAEALTEAATEAVTETVTETVTYTAQARALDAHVKDIFDPAGLYPDAPVPCGIARSK